MHKLIIDLEMCDRLEKEYYNEYKGLHEIIQIGAVLLDNNDKEIAQFETYVKPRHSILRQYITDLTHIEQKHIDSAPDIEDALNSLCEILVDKENTIMCTWSDSDTTVILKELDVKNITNDTITKLCNSYIDLQKEFSTKVKMEHRINLTKALTLIGNDFKGVEHGALADAINTARIYKELQNDNEVNSMIAKIRELMTDTPCVSTLGNMIDFSKFNLE